MKSERYEVRPAQPAAVREDLIRVWRNNLPVGEDANDKFRWLYEEAPILPEVAFVLYAKTADNTETIVGSAGFGVREFSVNGESIRAAVLGDLSVDKEHRTLLPALMLVRAARRYGQEHFGMLYGFPNEQSCGVVLRAGYRRLGIMHRYARVLRHSGYVERMAERENVPGWAKRLATYSLVKNALGVTVDTAKIARLGSALVRAVRSSQFAWIDPSDPKLDELWRACNSRYVVIGKRSSTFLPWRFPTQDGYRLAMLQSPSGEPRSYAVVRMDDTVAHIHDLFGFPEELQPLLQRLIFTLYREGASSISIRFLGCTQVSATLKACGFQQREASRTIVIDAIDHQDKEAWHIFDADEDA